MVIKVKSLGPKDMIPGGALIPMDSRRAKLREETAQGGEEVKKDETAVFQQRLKRMQEAKEVPAEQRVETPGELSHQLMEAGDYDNGPPFPLDYEPPPPWRRKGKEVATTIEKVNEELGKGVSVEYERCFEGNVEQK